LAGSWADPEQLELEAFDRGWGKVALELGEDEPFDGLGLAGRLREADGELEARWCTRLPAGIEIETDPDLVGRLSAGDQLISERSRQPTKDEPEWLEVVGGQLDRQTESEPLWCPAGPERVGLLAVRPGMEPGSLGSEAGDKRGPREGGDGVDPPEPEAK
jgi:hypothetical protein